MDTVPINERDLEMKDDSGLEHDLAFPPAIDPPGPNPPSQTEEAGLKPENLPTILPPANPEVPVSSLPQTTQTPPLRPSSQPPQAPAAPPPATVVRPEKPVAHGGPTRQYLNSQVTPHLLEALKVLAIEQPAKPLAWLADFLRERSAEVERD